LCGSEDSAQPADLAEQFLKDFVAIWCVFGIKCWQVEVHRFAQAEQQVDWLNAGCVQLAGLEFRYSPN